MRVIVDTNVLASGLFFKGIPFKILQGIKRGKYRTVVSQDIADEYKEIVDKLAAHFPNRINANTQLELIVLSSDICQHRKLSKPLFKYGLHYSPAAARPWSRCHICKRR